MKYNDGISAKIIRDKKLYKNGYILKWFSSFEEVKKEVGKTDYDRQRLKETKRFYYKVRIGFGKTRESHCSC